MGCFDSFESGGRHFSACVENPHDEENASARDGDRLALPDGFADRSALSPPPLTGPSSVDRSLGFVYLSHVEKELSEGERFGGKRAVVIGGSMAGLVTAR